MRILRYSESLGAGAAPTSATFSNLSDVYVKIHLAPPSSSPPPPSPVLLSLFPFRDEKSLFFSFPTCGHRPRIATQNRSNNLACFSHRKSSFSSNGRFARSLCPTISRGKTGGGEKNELPGEGANVNSPNERYRARVLYRVADRESRTTVENEQTRDCNLRHALDANFLQMRVISNGTRARTQRKKPHVFPGLIARASKR